MAAAPPPPSPNPNPSSTPSEKEGHLLLGLPTFTALPDGRLRCVESGHDLPAADRDRYSLSKACRLALIDCAVKLRTPPLNIFKPCPLSKSKLVCKLTGDTINKTEEHIWKHINGRRFLNRLELKEKEKLGVVEESKKESKERKKAKKVGIVEKDVEQEVLEEDEEEDGLGREMAELGIRPDDESLSDEGDEDTAGIGVDEKDDAEPVGVPSLTKQKPVVVGPSSCTSRKKRIKKSHSRVDGKDEAESVGASRRTKRTSVAVGPSSFAPTKKKIRKSRPSTTSDS